MSTATGRELRSVDLATGIDVLLDSGAAAFAPSIDNAGDSVLYWSGDIPQVRLARRDGSERRQLTTFAQGRPAGRDPRGG